MRDNEPTGSSRAATDHRDYNNESTRTTRGWLISFVISLVVAAVVIVGIRSRLKAETTLRALAAQTAVPSVSVVLPTRTAPAQEIILPGNIQPFISSPIYARTDGYLQKWYFDIGAHVKAGELLATIQTPEVDEQLAQARSTLATAEANLALAQITRDRYQSLLTKHAVPQQAVDNAVGTYSANKAIVDADQANVRHYAALVSFEKVYAPFDGVIVARNTDIGDLINSGSNTAPRTDLFDMVQASTLRVYVNVPEEYSQGVKVGQTQADLVLAEFPEKKFPGKLVRTADAINATTRTLLVEVDVANPSGTLFSGSYAEVHLKIPAQKSTLLIPVNTLIFRSEKLQVGVVQNGKVTVMDVTPGHDFGNEIEIVAGLNANDQIVLNPPDSLVSGEEIAIVDAALPGDSK
ncbi:MAG TPA: efflux RND transporter periplasmic adaptor subunit [Candidatus Acidoferrales bacterium]|nr:efflux RND transporter periplasmic adaptor subunit [Candidatus Acidoferrales bacterium]